MLLRFILLLFISVPALAQYRVVDAFPALRFSGPVDLQHAPGEDDRLFVVSQRGIIYSFENRSNVPRADTFLNISDRAAGSGEMGLLGLAFDPDYPEVGDIYCYYANTQRSIVARYSLDPSDPTRALKSSEKIIMRIEQTGEGNHKGGQIAFGPDRYLYIALGDGGSGGDPWNNAQTLTSPLGKILRIDVHDTSAGRAYAIPPDNPFAGNANGYREEIYAYGLRNPWRFSFDVPTGRLWAGDVGQGRFEEIDLIVKGGNYGWVVKEGWSCFRPANGCDSTGLVSPVWVYGHDGPDSMKGVSVIGGYVYRGSKLPLLVGKYIYADIGSGNIWALDYQESGPTTNWRIATTNTGLSSFGVDRHGELYFCGLATGKIYKLEATTSQVHRSDEARSGVRVASRVDRSDGNISIVYSLDRPSRVELSIHDVVGRRVVRVVDAARESGEHVQSIAGSSLPPGVYFYSLVVDGERSSGRFMVD